jgi:hypothetical protein
MSEKILKMIKKENSLDLTAGTISLSVVAFMDELNKLKEFLSTASEENQLCVGVGASGRANMLLNYLLPEAKGITAVYDESPERIGREMALSGIPVKQLDPKSEIAPANVLVLAWNFSEVLMSKWPNASSTFVLPLPEFSVIKKTVSNS